MKVFDSSAVRPGRRRILQAAAAAWLVPRRRTARASDLDPYPAHPIRLVVPMAAGGAADAFARLLAPRLALRLEQPVVISNLPGAGTIIGTQAVASAPGDGYTIGLIMAAHAINAALKRSTPYDALADFEFITLAGHHLIGLVAHPDLPADDVAQLLALTRQSTQPLHYASLGTGTGTHLAGALLCTLGGIRLEHVPYNGSARAVNDLLSGRVPLGFLSVESATIHLEAGRLKLLGLTSAGRTAYHLEYPSIAETLPGFEMPSLLGFVAPARTPADIVWRLSREIAAVLAMSEVLEQLANRAMVPVASSPDAFRQEVQREIRRNEGIIKQIGLKIE